MPASTTDIISDEAEVRALIMDCRNAKDTAAFADLYCEDAVVICQQGEAIGRTAVHKTLDLFNIPTLEMEIEAVHVSGDIATARGRYSVSLKKGEIKQDKGRYHTMFKKIDGKWRIHTDFSFAE